MVWASLVTQTVKCLPVLWETQVQSLDQEGPLEKEMATYSNILAWEIPQTEEPGRLWPIALQSQHDQVTDADTNGVHGTLL